MNRIGLVTRCACVAGVLACFIALATAAVQQPAGFDGSADAVRAALDAGVYTDAERLASLWVATVERLHGKESVEAARALDWLVEALLKNGKAGAADTLALAERAVRLKERQLGRDHPDLASSLDNLGAVHTDRGEMSAAVPLHERALTLRRRAPPPDGPAVADSLDHLALPLILLQRFRDAQQALEESQRIREAGANLSPLAQARTLYLVALLHRQNGQYAAATPLLDRVLEVRRQLLPPDHPEIRSAIQLQGELSFLQGNIAAARSEWTAALDMAERTLRPDHPDIAQVLRLLALAARAFGELTTARQLLERALPIAQHSLAPCHQGVSDVLADLANISGDEGDYQQAQTLLAQLAVYYRCLGPNDQRTATAVHNQALLAADMGDLPQAEQLEKRAIRMWSAGLGPDHPYVARGLDALAGFIAASGRPARARALYERALAMRRRTLGADHPDVAWTLANVAQLTGASGQLSLALEQVRQAIEIYERVGTGYEPENLARALLLRGSLEARSGDFSAARTSFREALTMRERNFGAAHPLVAEARADVGAADFALRSPDTALSEALDAEHIGRDHLRFTIRYLPERQAMEYAAKRPRGLDLALSIVAADGGRDPSAVLDSLVQSRGVILDELAARAKSVVGADPDLTALNAAVTVARERFANLMLRSFKGEEAVPRALLDEARQRKEDAERALAERSIAARAESARARIGLQDIQRALPAGTAMISFVRYDRTSFTTNQGRTTARVGSSYVAFVIPPATAAIAVVPLGPAASLESTIGSWRREVDGRSIAAGLPSAETERAYRTAGVRLRQRIWDPLAGHLQGATHVLIVPDGALNLVSFAALPIAGGRYLAENGPVVHFLSTERDIVSPEMAPSGRGLLALGGPTYDLHVSEPAVTGARRSGCGGPLRFRDLPGSRAEVRDISGIWSATRLAAGAGATATDDVTVLSGRAASKSAFMRASTGRRVVHLATHGFFLGSGCESAPGNTRSVGGLATISPRPPVVADNPLLLAGLAFAGANTNRGAAGRSGQDAGILTAEEVASLNLQGTEWAVLSACDTGLGEIRAGEGVFGLRRAFQIAGVRTIIMSLWSVEDQSTRNWMRTLYEGRFQQHLSTADAVNHANLRMLQNRRARGQSTHPFYWAAFVAAGDWN